MWPGPVGCGRYDGIFWSCSATSSPLLRNGRCLDSIGVFPFLFAMFILDPQEKDFFCWIYNKTTTKNDVFWHLEHEHNRKSHVGKKILIFLQKKTYIIALAHREMHVLPHFDSCIVNMNSNKKPKKMRILGGQKNTTYFGCQALVRWWVTLVSFPQLIHAFFYLCL